MIKIEKTPICLILLYIYIYITDNFFYLQYTLSHYDVYLKSIVLFIDYLF